MSATKNIWKTNVNGNDDNLATCVLMIEEESPQLAERAAKELLQLREKIADLLVFIDENAHDQLTLATLCDMVLGEDAEDRSDDALIRRVRELITFWEIRQ